MPAVTFAAILTDGRSIIDARLNVTADELDCLNRQVRETLGGDYTWEPVR